MKLLTVLQITKLNGIFSFRRRFGIWRAYVRAGFRAIELAGGLQASIVILPTAATPDHNHLRAGRNGQRWFESLGASRVDVVLVTDKPSADNPEFATRVAPRI